MSCLYSAWQVWGRETFKPTVILFSDPANPGLIEDLKQWRGKANSYVTLHSVTLLKQSLFEWKICKGQNTRSC